MKYKTAISYKVVIHVKQAGRTNTTTCNHKGDLRAGGGETTKDDRDRHTGSSTAESHCSGLGTGGEPRIPERLRCGKQLLNWEVRDKIEARTFGNRNCC